MIYRTLNLVCALLAHVAVACAQEPPAEMPAANFEKILISRDRAFLVGDPILVSGPQIKAAKWSWDGAYLLIEQEVGPFTLDAARASLIESESKSLERVVSLYHAPSGRTQVLFREDARQFVIEDFDWMRGGEALMLVGTFGRQANGSLDSEPKQTLYRINPARAQATPFSIDRDEVASSIKIDFAPDGDFALLSAVFDGTVRTDRPGGDEIQETSFIWQILRSDLSLQRVQLPEGALSMFFFFADNRPFARMVEGGAGARRRQWYALNPQSGELTAAAPPSGVIGERKRPAQIVQTRQAAASATNSTRTAKISSIWLETREPIEPNRLFIAGDAELAEVAPALRAVSYVAHGSLYLRPIEEISFTAYRKAKEVYERTMAMRRARAISIAFLMYGADHEDTFPSSRSDYASLIAPYLKDNDIFEGFLYTFAGGLITESSDPSRTQLGFIELSNGRVVAFIDGHVEWLPNRP